MSPRGRRMAVRVSSGGSRRRLVWAQFSLALTMSANAQNFSQDLLNQFKATTGMSTEGVTVMRTHLVVCPRALAAGDRWWIGLRITDLDDLTNAVTVNPLQADPQTVPYVDWMYARQFIEDTNVTAAGASGSGSYGGCVLDLRSKRKMHQLQQSYGLVIRQEAVATVAKTYDVFARILLALP